MPFVPTWLTWGLIQSFLGKWVAVKGVGNFFVNLLDRLPEGVRSRLPSLPSISAPTWLPTITFDWQGFKTYCAEKLTSSVTAKLFVAIVFVAAIYGAWLAWAYTHQHLSFKPVTPITSLPPPEAVVSPRPTPSFEKPKSVAGDPLEFKTEVAPPPVVAESPVKPAVVPSFETTSIPATSNAKKENTHAKSKNPTRKPDADYANRVLYRWYRD